MNQGKTSSFIAEFRKQKLDSNSIKIIAIIAMTIDHIAWLLFPGYQHGWIPIVMHVIGRITCPIMCYFIAEGFHHTKNIDKYLHDCVEMHFMRK